MAPPATLLHPMRAEHYQVGGRLRRLRREGLGDGRIGAIFRSRVFWPLAAALAAFAATAGLITYANHGGTPKLYFDAQLTEKACCLWQVWVNGLGPLDITSLDLKPGTRSTYAVPLQTQYVHFLRIALAGNSTVGDAVRINRIWTARGGRTIDEITAEEFRGFGGSNVVLRPDAKGLTYETTNQYPYFETGSGLITDAGPRRLFFIELGTTPFPALVAIMLLGAALAVPFAVASWRHALIVVGLGATLLIVRLLPWASHNLFEFRDDVSEAVGYSPFVGHWKTRDRAILQFAALAAFVVPAALAAGYWLLGRLRPGVEPATAEPPQSRGSVSLKLAAALITAPLVVFALLGMPDLKEKIGAGRTVEYAPHFDSNNFVFWRYLVRTTDLEPMADFFWPYGFQWIFQEPLPWSELASYAVFLSFWVWLALGTYWALSRFFSGRGLVLRYAGLMGFWLTVTLAGFVPFANRYLGPLGVVLLYAGISRSDRVLSPRRIVFAFALLELTLFELAQAVYALVPIAFLALAELVLDVRRTRPEVLTWLARGAGTVGVPIGLALGIYAATGTLGANIDYYGELDALNSAYAYPSAIDSWIKDPRSIDSFVLWAVPLTIALGMLGLLFQRGRGRQAMAIVVALGLLALMVMQKQVLRPHAAGQIWQTALFGLAFWAVVETGLHPVRRWMAVAAASATAFAIVLMSGDLRTGWALIEGAPNRAYATVDATLNHRGEFALDSQAEFKPARFRHFPEHLEVANRLARDPAVREGGPVWILGDDSPVTILLGRSWPYYYNEIYDTSPISFQKRLLSRLEDVPPSRVVWNFLASSYDEVPHVVRVPLLFEWTVRRFAPREQTNSFAILRPLRPREPPHLGWWRSRLGATVSLGHIPQVTTVHGDECSAGERCETYLVVEYPESAQLPPELAIPIHVGPHLFETKFPTVPQSRRYVVRLDRLWFWTAAPSGTRRRVDTSGLAGADVTFERREADPDTLY